MNLKHENHEWSLEYDKDRNRAETLMVLRRGSRILDAEIVKLQKHYEDAAHFNLKQIDLLDVIREEEGKTKEDD